MTGNELSFNLGFPPTHSLRHPDRDVTDGGTPGALGVSSVEGLGLPGARTGFSAEIPAESF